MKLQTVLVCQRGGKEASGVIFVAGRTTTWNSVLFKKPFKKDNGDMSDQLNTKEIEAEVHNCGKCDKKITEFEACAYCLNPLCSDCWESWGHCGHQVMYEKNTKAHVARITQLEEENKRLREELIPRVEQELENHKTSLKIQQVTEQMANRTTKTDEEAQVFWKTKIDLTKMFLDVLKKDDVSRET